MAIRYDIINAQEGSDIHGVVEKVAYQLYLRDSRGSSEKDWADAQGRVTDWAYRVACDHLESYFKSRLQGYAFSYSSSEVFTDFDNWMSAQGAMARLIIGDDDLIL